MDEQRDGRPSTLEHLNDLRSCEVVTNTRSTWNGISWPASKDSTRFHCSLLHRRKEVVESREV